MNESTNEWVGGWKDRWISPSSIEQLIHQLVNQLQKHYETTLANGTLVWQQENSRKKLGSQIKDPDVKVEIMNPES